MNYTETLDENYSGDTVLSGEIKLYLKETAKWAKLMAIIGFVFLGLMVLMALFMGTFMGAMSSGLEGAGMFMGAFSILSSIMYLVMSAIIAVPLYYLYQFANKMQVALDNDDTATLTDSFRFLKSYYKFYGILTLVFVVLYGAVFILGLLGGFASMMF